MYKVLVVDDDKVIRGNLIQSVQWIQSGFILLGEAFDGKNALKKIEEELPDLIITDICMPIMDGIELIQTIKELYPQIKFIVLSNHDDFQYVKSALKNGALDYILKYEISEDSMIRLLKQAKTAIDEEYKKKEARELLNKIEKNQYIEKMDMFWNNVLNGKLSKQSLDIAAEELNIKLHPLHGVFLMLKYGEDGYIQTFDTIIDKIQQAFKNDAMDIFMHDFKLKNEGFGIFLNYRDTLSISQIIFNVMEKVRLLAEMVEINNVVYLISVSDVFHNIEDMILNAAKCKEMLKDMYYNPENHIITARTFIPFSKSICIQGYEKIFECILKNLFTKNLTEATKSFKLFIDKIREDRIDPELVNRIYHNLINRILINKNTNKSMDYHESIVQTDQFDNLPNILVVQKELLKMFQIIAKELYPLDIQSENEDIQRAIDFIIKNSSTQIGLQEVADFVSLSKNHFCRLFKQETNENFLDFLNKIRVEHAKKLLVSTELTVNEIAFNVGFNDYRYFKKIYFKYTGELPSEFRKSSI